ncbi:MAG: primosomal protein N' [Halanaerobiaceae bacterium]
MKKYARVAVNVPVSEGEGIFTYSIPVEERKDIQIGSAVRVSFGHRKAAGFVVGFEEKPEIKTSRIKDIEDLLYRESFFDTRMLELFFWVSEYYFSPLIRVIRAALPSGILSGKQGKKTRKYVSLTADKEEVEEFIRTQQDRAPRQVLVLRELLQYDNEYSAREIINITDCQYKTLHKLQDKGFLKYYSRAEQRIPVKEKHQQESIELKPTPDQKQVMEQISAAAAEERDDVFLLHGVTGSGKTEVYLQMIAEVVEAGRGAVVLVPEISLTPVMVRRFYSRLGETVAVLHSRLSPGEKYDEWKRLKDGKAQIAIGARSAIFAPVRNPGLFVIDEEHETTYKQNNPPCYHARRVAVERGRLHSAPVILGSATPSLESYFYARHNKFNFNYLSLPERIHSRPLPPVEVVDMREELKKGNTSIFSRPLKRAVRGALDQGEQVLLFLNRRGYSSFVLCRECGKTIKCTRCDISLTLHSSDNRLHCHYCGFSRSQPESCPHCGSQYIRDFGIGTEKIEESVCGEFPRATVERMDVDTTGKKGSHRRILRRLEEGDIDILVGTQMIAKGHDYPGISVVGVISADTIINLPEFRAAERTFQLLTQVAGRTGRGEKSGRVLVQTYTPDHYSIQAARDHNYGEFYNCEIKLRRQLNYPPFTRMINIIIRGEKENKVEKKARQLGKFIKKYSHLACEVCGPSPAPLSRIKGRFRWQIILKFRQSSSCNQMLEKINSQFISKNRGQIDIKIDVNPVQML